MNKTTKFISRNSSTILMLFGCAGVVCTAVSAINETPKALGAIQMSRAQTKREMFIAAAPCYIPTMLFGLSTIGCIVGSNMMAKKHQASIVSAYGLLDQSYKHYIQASKDVYGENADNEIRAKVAKNQYLATGGYNTYDPESDIDAERILCYDEYSEQYFTTTMANVIHAQLLTARKFVLEGEVTVNEYYDYLGIPEIINGDEFGWSCEFFDSGTYWLDFDNIFITLDDGLQCCIVSPHTRPEVINEHYFK